MRRDEVRADPRLAQTEIANAEAEGSLEEILVVGGQSAGLIAQVLPAADIVRIVAAEAEMILADVAALIS